MLCFRCHAENAPGSRFCGNCGGPIDDEPAPSPRVTSPTGQMTGTAQPPLPPLARDGRPEILDESLGGSLRVPVSRGARLATVLIVVVLDLAMAVTGIVLLTRSSGPKRAEATANGPAPARDGGPTIVTPPSAVDAGARTGDGVEIGGDTRVAPRPTSKRPRIDAGAPAPRIDAGAPAPRPDAAAGPAPAPAPDAAAGPAPAPAPDAAAGPVPAPAPDAGATPADDDPAADAIPDQVAVFLARSSTRLSRCYSQATKGLPDDQPLEGEVDIAFEVMPTGGTRNVTVARNTTGSTTLASCIAGVVGEWVFDPFDGASVDVVRTFRFRPAG